MKENRSYALNLITTENDHYISHYKMRNEQGKAFHQHGGIWLLELQKFYATHIESEQQRWIKFFKDGEHLNDNALPDWMQTQEMRQAMNTLSTFSEKEHQYHQYQARQEYLREQRTIQLQLEEATRALVKERLEKEALVKQNEAVVKAMAKKDVEVKAMVQENEAVVKEKNAEIERLNFVS